MSMSRPVKLKLRSGIECEAKRVPPDDHDQFCLGPWGAILLEPGDWVVDMPAGKLALKDDQVRAIFVPVDETLLRRWNS